MGTEISRGKGKLYRISSEQFVDDINYQVHEDSADLNHWWGELTLINSMSIPENDRYMIELEDRRNGECYLKKLVNRVVRGVPPRYVYHIRGISPLV